MSGSDAITDGIVAGSGAGELGDAIHASRRKKQNRPSAFESPTPPGTCSNCRTDLSGPVCHSCGQTSDNYHRPVWELLLEVLDGLFGLDGRIWRTVPQLMLRPGKITRQYLSGVRARYVMPFRLYLTASILFFVLFAIAGGTSGPRGTEPDPADIATVRELLDESELEARLEAEGMSPEQRAELERLVGEVLPENPDDLIPPEARAAQAEAGRQEMKDNLRRALLPEDYPDEVENDPAGGAPDETTGDRMAAPGLEIREDGTMRANGLENWPRPLRERLVMSGDRIIDSGGQALVNSMTTWAPRVLFGLLPIYALLLAVTHFYKRGYFYYDHLVVSLHFHAFIFFLFVALIPASAVIGIAGSFLVFLGWSNFYLYRLHRVVYSHGVMSSIIRTVFMDLVYFVVLLNAMLILLVIGLLNA